MKFAGDETVPYRWHRGRRYPHWAHQWHMDFWFRSWQSEAPSTCGWARRSWTARGAQRKMRRDVWLAQHGVTSLHQWRRAARADWRKARLRGEGS